MPIGHPADLVGELGSLYRRLTDALIAQDRIYDALDRFTADLRRVAGKPSSPALHMGHLAQIAPLIASLTAEQRASPWFGEDLSRLADARDMALRVVAPEVEGDGRAGA